MAIATLTALSPTTKVADNVLTKNAVRIHDLVTNSTEIAAKGLLGATLEIVKPITTPSPKGMGLLSTATQANAGRNLQMAERVD
jgi:hypothetical protein